MVMIKFIKLHDRGRPLLVPLNSIALVWQSGHLTYVKIAGMHEQAVDEKVDEIEALINFDPAVADIVRKGNEL